MRRKYSIKAKGFKMVTEELKQRITAKTRKRYKARALSIDKRNCFAAIRKHYMKNLV